MRSFPLLVRPTDIELSGFRSVSVPEATGSSQGGVGPGPSEPATQADRQVERPAAVMGMVGRRPHIGALGLPTLEMAG